VTYCLNGYILKNKVRLIKILVHISKWFINLSQAQFPTYVSVHFASCFIHTSGT